MIVEADKANTLEVVDNENGTKNVVIKQFEVEIGDDGKKKIVEKDPITMPGTSKAGLLASKNQLEAQLADVELLLTKFE